MFNIGQRLYEVRVIPSQSKKICMTDKDGLEWFRWEGTRFKYSIVTNEIIGITSSTLQGTASSDSELEHRGATIIHIRPDDMPSVWCYELDLATYLRNGIYWFRDLESANKKINTLKEY